jgi:Abortive infection alpha
MSDDFTKTAPQILAALAKDIYQDAAHPPLKTLGEALDGIFKAVFHYPRYWGQVSDISLDVKKEEFRQKLNKRVSEIPEGRRILPSPAILGPSVQALEYGIFEDHLSEMFANLIASAMDSESSLHPSFVEIIKQMSPYDAIFLEVIAKLDGMYGVVDVSDTSMSNSYVVRNFMMPFVHIFENNEHSRLVIDNLERLKIIEIERPERWPVGEWDEIYNKWFSDFIVDMGRRGFPEENYVMNKKILFLTSFGRSFISACVKSKIPEPKE